MTFQLSGACLLAFLAVFLFGKAFVPWLGKKGFIQPLKKVVEDRVYSETDSDADTDQASSHPRGE